jgi:hypothetical protein
MFVYGLRSQQITWTSLFFFFCGTGLELRVLTLSHSTSPVFVMGFFQDRVSQTICPGWLWTTIFLISASWVAGITGMSPRCPVLSSSIKFCGHLDYTWTSLQVSHLGFDIYPFENDQIHSTLQQKILSPVFAQFYFFSFTSSYYFVLFCFFGGNEVWTQGFVLTKQVLDGLSYTFILLWLFWRWSLTNHLPRLAFFFFFFFFFFLHIFIGPGAICQVNSEWHYSWLDCPSYSSSLSHLKQLRSLILLLKVLVQSVIRFPNSLYPWGRLHGRTRGCKWSLLKGKEGKYKGDHGEAQVEPGGWESVHLFSRCF